GYGAALDTIEHVKDSMRNWRNTECIYKWCRQVGLIEPKSQERWFDSIQGNNAIQMFSVVDNNCYVGVCGLTSIHWIHRSAELSYYIAPEYMGTLPGRFGLKVFKTLIRYAFDGLGLNRVFGDSFEPNNVAIMNLCDLGLKQEGVLRESYYKDGKFINSVVQSMLRSEYEEVKGDW
ncbi:MAG: GNAT family protein, partial [Leptolyngbyaceae bacterium]|nr:GNAT family protein [Leptolyngbyaceae bacterium]